LPKAVVEAIRAPANAVYASAASTWEIAIKAAIGKLHADLDEPLPVSIGHTCGVRRLPAHHRDPFDRVLIAQALEEGLTLITRDPAFAMYRVPILWS
jgi:PIN domain nuclease of toxin-antitoxin system